MGTVGTFDAFTTARLGIYAAHKGLSVTGNNIANINTKGYTRQVVDQVSLKTGANDMYRSQFDNHVGNGALVTGISQIRDPYLDIRFRNTSSDVGFYDEKLAGLQKLKSILDEVGKGENKGDGLLYAQLQDLADALRAISADPTKDNDTLAMTSADALVSLFNTYANKLENLRVEYVDSLKQDVTAVNDILTNIRNLNETIRESDVHGDPALEMRDERNRQIDALSEYMHIKVTYSMEDIGGGLEVERCTISLANDNPDPSVTTDSSILVDGIYGSQIALPEKLPVMNENYDPAAAAANKNLMADPNFDPTDPADMAKLNPNGFRYVKADADGKPMDPPEYTDDAGEAAEVDNKNYIITIGKLLDAGGEEWAKPTTTWTRLADGVIGVKAKYTFTVEGSEAWEAGDEITIGKNTYKIGGTKQVPVDPGDPDAGTKPEKVDGDISAADANKPEKMAAFIAKCLDGSDDYKDTYTVRANGDKIIFTAKNSGVVGAGNGGPDAEPTLNVTPGAGAAGTTTLGAITEVRPGVDSEPPVNDPDYHGGTTWNPDGSETKITFVEGENGWMKCTVVVEHTYDVTLDHNDLHGSLQATRELLTGEGDFATTDTIADVDENAAIKRGIPYYQKSFDLLARQFAEQYNKLNQGYMVNEKGNYIDADGKELEIGGVPGPVSKTNGLTAEQEAALEAADLDLNTWLELNNAKKPEGVGVLFSNRNDGDDTEGITAANISISASWSRGDVKIVPTFVELFGKDPGPLLDENGNPVLDENGKPIPNTTQNENANHMLTMINQSLLYDPRTLVEGANGTKLFQGSFNDMFSNMNIVLGNDQRTTNTKLSAHYSSLVETDTSRDGVSGVDLNDEAMNMMQYQKAYSAACRLMTAIDEALDRLINNTGIAGR